MIFDFVVEPGTFVARPNRFVVQAELAGGEIVRAHCADPGRLRELLLPGAVLYVSPAKPSATRRTSYDLRFVEHPSTGQLVSLDTRVPNKLVHQLLNAGAIGPFAKASNVRAEVVSPVNEGTTRSRFDFQIVDADATRTWIEVKSVTLVEDGIALFPDAPTDRGRRHLEELTAIVQQDLGRAAVIFIVQRPDASLLRPHVVRDPAFAAALAEASACGVDLYAYTCTLSREKIQLNQQIPVVADAIDTAG